jgi:hypothetical protein
MAKVNNAICHQLSGQNPCASQSSKVSKAAQSGNSIQRVSQEKFNKNQVQLAGYLLTADFKGTLFSAGLFGNQWTMNP